MDSCACQKAWLPVLSMVAMITVPEVVLTPHMSHASHHVALLMMYFLHKNYHLKMDNLFTGRQWAREDTGQTILTSH